MGFFEDIDLSWPSEDEPEEWAEPEWMGKPKGWVGGVVPLELLVARSESAAVYVAKLVAYPSGFAFAVNTLVRQDGSAGALRHTAWDSGLGWPHDPDELGLGGGPARVEDLPPELLRFGLGYSDGRKATSLREWIDGIGLTKGAGTDEESGPDPATDLVLVSGGGGGDGHHTEQEYWAWPLPPNGPVTFVCEWPGQEIPETAVELDAELIRGAAERAHAVWD